MSPGRLWSFHVDVSHGFRNCFGVSFYRLINLPLTILGNCDLKVLFRLGGRQVCWSAAEGIGINTNLAQIPRRPIGLRFKVGFGVDFFRLNTLLWKSRSFYA